MRDDMADYDDSNIFARILRGDMPGYTVYEDGATLAMLDIMPRVDGHCLVLPRAPSRNLLDAAPADLAACLATAQRVARAARQAFAADGVTLWQNSETAGGQMVFHTHFHVMPRHAGIDLRPAGIMAAAEALAAHQARIMAALAD